MGKWKDRHTITNIRDVSKRINDEQNYKQSDNFILGASNWIKVHENGIESFGNFCSFMRKSKRSGPYVVKIISESGDEILYNEYKEIVTKFGGIYSIYSEEIVNKVFKKMVSIFNYI